MAEIQYTKAGDYYFPNITMKQETREIGIYGRRRLRYLEEERQALWAAMLGKGTLNQHLADVDEAARNMLERLMPKLAAEAGATEELKREDPLEWAGLMNNCRAQVEEIISSELIYR